MNTASLRSRLFGITLVFLSTCFAQPAVAALHGVFSGSYDEPDTAKFEAFVGRPVAYATFFGGYASWADFTGSVPWGIGQWSQANPNRKLLYSIGLIPGDGSATLAQAGQGVYNQYYLSVAQAIAAKDPAAIIRVGWEFNGNWYPWSAGGHEQEYITAYRQFVTVFRSVSPNFTFDWCVSRGASSMPAENAYPGDAYVDVIGMDYYDFNYEKIADPVARWQFMLTEDHGLTWHKNFAAAHNKPMSFPEWQTGNQPSGVGMIDNPYIMGQLYSWILSNNFAYESFWNDGQMIYPLTQEAAVYQDDFGSLSNTDWKSVPLTFTTSESLNVAQAHPGDSVTLTALITSNLTEPNMIIGSDLLDANGNQIAPARVSSVNLVGNSANAVNLQFQIPATAIAGNYHFSLMIFDSNWSTKLWETASPNLQVVTAAPVALTFQTNNALSSTSTPAGSALNVATSIVANQTLTNLTARISILGSDGSVIVQQDTSGVNLVANQEIVLTNDLIIPSNTQRGSYSLSIAIWDANWKTLLWKYGNATVVVP